ncbi:hypothetical protein BLNAU_13174 [Blattamonas nauphoetae]|uniref:TUG ubiquitin-like domain-containing protein n=1 Tax=Blattamonas nauphoetae TaxID=2049346 RepID=A0ABQ9XHL5_9EUKA|nr:hypothetical protein BLNAU_13174 [Blattamonas nauphoetae]
MAPTVSVQFNGQKTKINVTPGTLMKDVAASACQTFLISPSNAKLFFKDQPIDLSSPYRLTGLIANSIVQLKIVSSTSKETSVTVALQMESKRLLSSFPKWTTLWGLLKIFESDPKNGVILTRSVSTVKRGFSKSQKWDEPTLFYLQREIRGIDDLSRITLEALGCEGNVAIRYLKRVTDSSLEAMIPKLQNADQKWEQLRLSPPSPPKTPPLQPPSQPAKPDVFSTPGFVLGQAPKHPSSLTAPLVVGETPPKTSISQPLSPNLPDSPQQQNPQPQTVFTFNEPPKKETSSSTPPNRLQLIPPSLSQPDESNPFSDIDLGNQDYADERFYKPSHFMVNDQSASSAFQVQHDQPTNPKTSERSHRMTDQQIALNLYQTDLASSPLHGIVIHDSSMPLSPSHPTPTPDTPLNPTFADERIHINRIFEQSQRSQTFNFDKPQRERVEENTSNLCRVRVSLSQDVWMDGLFVTSTSTVGDVFAWIQEALSLTPSQYTIFTTPPRKVFADPSQTFQSAGFISSINLRFSTTHRFSFSSAARAQSQANSQF